MFKQIGNFLKRLGALDLAFIVFLVACLIVVLCATSSSGGIKLESTRRVQIIDGGKTDLLLERVSLLLEEHSCLLTEQNALLNEQNVAIEEILQKLEANGYAIAEVAPEMLDFTPLRRNGR